MQPTLDKLSPADVNRHWMNANVRATRFVRAREQEVEHRRLLVEHKERQRSIYELSTMTILVSLLLIPAFFLAGISEGLLVAPIFESTLFAELPPRLRQLISFLPVLVLLGISLGAGYCAHRIVVRRDALDPRRLVISSGWIIALSVLITLYVGFLYLLARAAMEWAPEVALILHLIPVMGFCELVLGFFAAFGFLVVFTLGKERYLNWRADRCHVGMKTHAKACHEQFQLYHQVHDRYQQEGNAPLPMLITPKIQAAIYFDRTDGSDDDPGKDQPMTFERA